MFFRPNVQVENFEAAALPHLTDLYRTASFLLRDRNEAEDLIQDTYLEAWKSFHRFELGTNCRAWLFKIMFHRLHHVRRRLVKASRVTTIDGPEGQDELAAEPAVPQEIRDEDVLNALDKIAVEFREIVLLASGCRGVLLQGDCGNVENPGGNGYVEIESRKKAATARVSGSSPLVWYQPAHEAGWCGGNGMNTLSFDSKRCERIRQQLDSYLSNELLVETASEVVRHLESCEACSRDLESRMRVRDVLQRAVANRPMPESMRANILRTLRDSQRRSLTRVAVKRWALGFAAAAVVLFGVFAAESLNLRHGEQLIASILKLGVSDHVICAIQGHNYPEVANPPDQIREKLGARYAPLLQVVQQRLPGFELLEGHICSIPGSDRKYVHFITRGHGTILSVILTERNGAALPRDKLLPSADSDGLGIYQDHLSGMEIAGFESGQYFAFVVSDLNQKELLQLARGLAPSLNETLHTTARLLPPNATTKWAKLG